MKPTLKISEKNIENESCKVVMLEGEFDNEGYDNVRDTLDNLLEAYSKDAKVKHVVFDFSDLKYINSQGIGILMEVQTKLLALDKKMVIVGLNSNVKDVFETIGMKEMTTIYEDLTSFLNK